MEQWVQTNPAESKTNEFRSIERFVLRWGSFALLGALVGAVWPLRWAPQCLFFRLTGYPCFTCGVTRSLKALASGRFMDAVRFQPLMVVAGVGLVVLMIVCALRRALGYPGWEWARIPTSLRWGMLAAGVVAVVINWIYLVETMGN
jgi:hypothetical protein